MFFKPDFCFNDREPNCVEQYKTMHAQKNRLNNASNRTQRGAFSVSLLKHLCRRTLH